jgi:hypothetical protein
MHPRQHPVDLLAEPRVLVEANHLVYYCQRDPIVHGWRCGRCEVGLLMSGPGQSLPQPGRACTVCLAEVCFLKNESILTWRGPLTALVMTIVATWPLLFWWVLAR